jgi:hypothetical protein
MLDCFFSVKWIHSVNVGPVLDYSLIACVAMIRSDIYELVRESPSISAPSG